MGREGTTNSRAKATCKCSNRSVTETVEEHGKGTDLIARPARDNALSTGEKGNFVATRCTHLHDAIPGLSFARAGPWSEKRMNER